MTMTQESSKEAASSGGSESLGDNARHRERRDKNVPPSKVVVRRLPPAMTAETFLEQISPVPENDYLYFVRADMRYGKLYNVGLDDVNWPLPDECSSKSAEYDYPTIFGLLKEILSTNLGQHAFARAYINFLNQEDIYIFKDKFDGYVFVDPKGNEYPAVVEFATFQKIPKKKVKKKDAKCGTVEQDPDYIKFVESLQNPEEVVLPSAESYLEEIEARERELKANNGIPRITTPLIEYIKHKKAERQRIREEKREERKRREMERKRLREEERKRRKAEKEKEKESEKHKDRTKDSAKDKEDRKSDEKSKSEPVLKLLKNPERDKEKDTDKEAPSKDKPAVVPDKTVNQREKHTRPVHNWEKERRLREEERQKQREKHRDRLRERDRERLDRDRDKDKMRRERDDTRNSNSSLASKSDNKSEETSSKGNEKERVKDDATEKPEKPEERETRFKKPDYKVKPERYRDDYHGRRDDWNKGRPERKWDDDRYRQDRRGNSKPFERGYNRDKVNRFDNRTKDFKDDKGKTDKFSSATDEDSSKTSAKDKPHNKVEEKKRYSSDRPKYDDGTRKNSVSLETKEKTEDVTKTKPDRTESSNVTCGKAEIKDQGANCEGANEQNEDLQKGDDNGRQDPRTERRIRNKDRPSLELYRPGMRRLGMQSRSSPQKETQGSASSSSSPSPTPQVLSAKVVSSTFTKAESPDSSSASSCRTERRSLSKEK